MPTHGVFDNARFRSQSPSSPRGGKSRRSRSRFHRLLPHVSSTRHGIALAFLLLSGILDSYAAIIPSQIVTLDAEESAIRQGQELLKANDSAAALKLFKTAIESPVFTSLDPVRQHAIYQVSGAIAYGLTEYANAQTYFTRACESPHAVAEDWKQRFFAAYQLDDKFDKTASLTLIAQRWPATLSDINDDAILRTANESLKDPTSAGKTLDLLAALFASGWKIEGGIEPSSLWREYALILIAREQLVDVKAVAARITRPGELISMRADSRFFILVNSMPARFDIDKAAAADLALMREISAKQLQHLRNVVELTYSLLTVREYAQTLKITDGVITTVHGSNKEKPPYDDLDESYIWILNNRALALQGLGRWEEALEQLIRAARRPERAGTNVSQAINLAGYYNDLERPKDALFMLLDVENTSPYGRMQVEKEKYRAALQLQEAAAAKASLSYLREHQSDSISTYQDALLEGGDMEAAAGVLIGRLQDPAQRTPALLWMQDYEESPAPPHVLQFRGRMRVLKGRADVRNAVASVGRIEHYNLSSDFL